MNILYFGTVCDAKNYDNLLKGCKAKPSVAPLVFESSFLDGMKKNGAEMEIYSFPMVPTFPNCKLLRFGGFKEKLECGYECRWLYTVNLPVLKQLSRKLSGRRAIKSWCKKNRGDGLILTYSVPPFLVGDVLKYGKKYGVGTVAIIPDLLRDMYVNEKPSLLTRLKNLYIRPALKKQSGYDGYVYLTEAMAEVVAPDKPYTVMEGIALCEKDAREERLEKAFPYGIMYAGMLHEKYGIINLIDAFEALKREDAELWLFGDGSARAEIERRAAANPSIRYFGTVSRGEILEYEKKATLLINPRDPDEEFTQYSFPSKTVEYMLSGTPLITTKLRGIPDEYFGYTFASDGNSVAELKSLMEKCLSLAAEELCAFGKKACRFITEEKNSKKQALKVINFLKEVQYDA
ncbi:MAG: glycosyltransferase [Clostridia bacterium]|nr:glycosyltransferase [Clostridia bacterium]